MQKKVKCGTGQRGHYRLHGMAEIDWLTDCLLIGYTTTLIAFRMVSLTIIYGAAGTLLLQWTMKQDTLVQLVFECQLQIDWPPTGPYTTHDRARTQAGVGSGGVTVSPYWGFGITIGGFFRTELKSLTETSMYVLIFTGMHRVSGSGCGRNVGRHRISQPDRLLSV